MNLDLTKERDVVVLMRSSQSEEAWNQNCDTVKAANNDKYPEFWYRAVILSGVFSIAKNKW